MLIRMVRIGPKPELKEKVMNAVNGLAKVVVCSVAAMVLTTASSLSFVESTARASYATDMPTVIVMAKAEPVRLAGTASAGLLQ